MALEPGVRGGLVHLAWLRFPVVYGVGVYHAAPLFAYASWVQEPWRSMSSAYRPLGHALPFAPSALPAHAACFALHGSRRRPHGVIGWLALPSHFPGVVRRHPGRRREHAV